MCGVIQCFVLCDGLYASICHLSVEEDRYFKINKINFVLPHLRSLITLNRSFVQIIGES